MGADWHKASSISSGRRAPFEELSSSSESSESDSSSSSASSFDEVLSSSLIDLGPHEDLKLPPTELLRVRHAISTFITNLYKISTLIRWNPSPHDRLIKAAKIDISSYEPFDQQHVREKFPMANDRLIERLGKANSQRRRYFKYRENHRQWLSLPTENSISESKSLETSKLGEESTPSKIEEVQPVSYQLSETHRANSFSVKASTAASTFIPSQPLKPFNLVQVDQESDPETRKTHDSDSSTNHDHLRIPAPRQILESSDFECPFCFHIFRLKSTKKWDRDKEWKRHLFKDLQPYICTSGDCAESYTMFERRRDWIRHETRFHIREWCCNVPEHEVFSDKKKFKLHMDLLHPEFCNDLQMDTVIEMFQRPMESATVKCPLCLNNGQGALTIGAFEKHVARHLESLALFALPRLDVSETRSLGSVVTLNPSKTSSYTSENR
ncbi:MAG: hypothetical protein Q9214_001765 [Letrouitia sp. 1 TL-2023]